MNITINKFLAITSILALVPTLASAAPQFNPANGHYYEVIPDVEIIWSDAKSAADISTHLGVSGHLATITSDAEGNFVETLRMGLSPSEAWIGGSQTTCVGDPDEEPTCGWEWENGEGTFPGDNLGPGYAKWLSSEPNDNYGLGSENHLTIGLIVTDPTKWNDEGTMVGQGIENIGGYVIEWDTIPPTANDDPGNMANSGETINIDVLANDVLNGQTVTAINITSPSTNGGTATPGACTGDNIPPLPALPSPFCVDYTSAPGFGQEDSFGYTVSSGDLESNEATVTIDVDGSVSETPPGDDITVFGGPENGVPLLAVGEFAPESGTSTIKCCTVRDPRVKLKTRWNGSQKIIHKGYPFDIGKAMDTHLAVGCGDLPQPGDYELIVPRHFSVHTEEEGELDPDKYVFGLCVVETEVEWLGAVNLDIDATPAVGYQVECDRMGVKNQPLTLGLTTFPPEFNAPLMRPVTTECNPRGAPKWSTWYFIPNAVHLTNKLPSKWYVLGRIFVLKLMILSMHFDPDNPVDGALLNSVWSKVNSARNIVWGPTPASAALPILDTATIEVLTPDVEPPGIYNSTAKFPNPKGELTSHLMALRYAVCNELAFVNMPASCKINDDVDDLLPELPATP